jgi:hypothetical protein
MKKVIDDLFYDNNLLRQCLDDSKRVIELIVFKYKELRKSNKDFISLGEIRKKYEVIIHEKKVINKVSCILIIIFEDIKLIFQN